MNLSDYSVEAFEATWDLVEEFFTNTNNGLSDDEPFV